MNGVYGDDLPRPGAGSRRINVFMPVFNTVKPSNLCLDIAAVLPESTKQDVADWKAQKQVEHSDQELLDLFELKCTE